MINLAILNNLLVNGASRFLGKIYAQDLEVSGTTSFQAISATSVSTGTLTASSTISATGDINTSGAIKTGITGLYINGRKAIFTSSTTDAWLRINEGKPFPSGVYFGASLIRTDGELQVGSAGAFLKSNSTNTTIANLVAPLADISSLVADNVSVINNLKSNHWDLTSVAQLGGSFYISPTILFPTTQVSGTRQLVVAKSGTTLTLTITDPSITSTTIAGAVWGANGRVKVSGKINNVTTGTLDGTISAINTSSHTLTLSLTGDIDDITAGTYSSTQYENLSVMLYQRRDGTNDYRVGIWMNCYDTANESATIRIYGGTDTNPNVAIGNLTNMGLPTVNGVTPTGWSLYAADAYLTGTVVANGGLIGDWTIGTKGLYYNSDTPSSTSVTLIPSGTTASSNAVGGSSGSKTWVFTVKDVFGVDTSGWMYVSNGKIGGWTITSTALTNGTYGSDNSTFISTTDMASKAIAGRTGADWRLTIGSHFGVTSTGAIYANSGTIGGFTIASSSLYSNGHSAYNTAANGIYIGNDYISFGSGGVTYFSNTGTGKVGPWTLSTTYFRNGNIANATNTSVAGVYLGTDGINISNGTAATTAYITKTAVNIGDKLTWNGTTLSIEGNVTATSGSIANWRIESSYLASGNATSPGTNVLLLSPGGTTSSYTIAGKTAAGWVFTSGTTFGIHRDGELYATAGQIGGLTIATNSLHTANVAITSNADGSVGISSADFTRTVAGASRTDLRLAIGSNFGVSNSGVLYAKNANIDGNITATSGTIGGWTIESTYLKYGTPGMANGALLSPGGYAISIQTSNSISVNYFNYINTLVTGGTGAVDSYNWTFTVGNNFGIKKDGGIYSSALYCNGGAMGGWRINSSGIHCDHNSSNIQTKNPYSGLTCGNYAFYAGETNGEYGSSESDAKIYITQDGRLKSIGDKSSGEYAELFQSGLATYFSGSSYRYVTYFGRSISLENRNLSSGSVEYETNISGNEMTLSQAVSPYNNITLSAVTGNISFSGRSLSWLTSTTQAAIILKRGTGTSGLNTLASVAGVNGKWVQGVLEENDAYVFGYLLNSRTTNGYDALLQITKDSFVQLSGTTSATIRATATTAGSQIQVYNNFRKIALHASNASTAGIYDDGNKNWIIYSGSDQTVYIPHHIENSGYIHSAGSISFMTHNHGIYLATTSSDTSYPALYDNGSNLWIGASSTSGPHHIGGTYISAGHTGSAGNATIYVSVPNASNDGGSNYAVLHAGNYSSYIKTVISYENGSGSPIITDGTDGHKVSVLRVTAATTAGIKSQKGTAGGTAAWVNFTIGGSDRRLKENIVDSKINALSEINNIRMRSFDWKDSKEHWNVGFIAQEAYGVDPLLAIKPENEDEEIWSINDFYITGLLTKAMQEEDSKVTKLEKQVSELEQENQELRQRIIRLEATVL